MNVLRCGVPLLVVRVRGGVCYESRRHNDELLKHASSVNGHYDVTFGVIDVLGIQSGTMNGKLDSRVLVAMASIALLINYCRYPLKPRGKIQSRPHSARYRIETHEMKWSTYNILHSYSYSRMEQR